MAPGRRQDLSLFKFILLVMHFLSLFQKNEISDTGAWPHRQLSMYKLWTELFVQLVIIFLALFTLFIDISFPRTILFMSIILKCLFYERKLCV